MAHTVGTWMELTACNCELSFTCTGVKKRVFWQAWLLRLHVKQSLCHHICNVACLQSMCSQIQSKIYTHIYIYILAKKNTNMLSYGCTRNMLTVVAVTHSLEGFYFPYVLICCQRNGKPNIVASSGGCFSQVNTWL